MIIEAHFTSLTRGLGRFRTEQPPYSLLARGAERSVFPACMRLGMGVLTWSPLAWGMLSGRFRRGVEVDFTNGRPALRPAWFDVDAAENAAKLDAIEAFAEIADSLDLTLPELSLAFPIAHPAVTSVIIGPPRDGKQAPPPPAPISQRRRRHDCLPRPRPRPACIERFTRNIHHRAEVDICHGRPPRSGERALDIVELARCHRANASVSSNSS